MPEVGTQSKTFDPLRAVNGSVSPFIGHFWLQEGISGDDLFDLGIGCEALRVVNQREAFLACRRKLSQCRRMKRFAVAPPQGHRADILGVERLPAHRYLRPLCVILVRSTRED